ncbi:MAG: dehydrogenase [Acidimicrobiaceae bacterium]|nr:dehydrogenase [Acidimicrobiaceae bacterium]|tara:strand:- start:603 stop:1385 length:783 start_codon:yes stop_codon:yes gene_type:complete
MFDLPDLGESSCSETVAIITGGGSGIGASVAERLNELGSKVIIVDIDEQAGRTIADSVGCDFINFDVGDLAAWEKIVADTVERFGSLDFLCLNAGIGSRPRGSSVKDDPIPWILHNYKNVIAVNIDGVVYGTMAALPVMENQRSGSILVTASVAGIRTQPPDPIYALSKSAVISFVRSVAPALADRGVRINALCPGSVDTPIQPDERRLARRPMSPPEEIAEAIGQILISDDNGGIWIASSSDYPVWRYEFASAIDGPPS